MKSKRKKEATSCSLCSSSIKTRQHFLKCYQCSSKYHRTCLGKLSHREFKEQKKQAWTCSRCSSSSHKISGSYSDEARRPGKCGDSHNSSCVGNQSPILIPASFQIFRNAERATLIFNQDYKENQNFILTNTGYTIQASSRSDLTSTSFIQGDILGGRKYVFSQIHFHWGSNDRQGSEHTFNNISFPMEGHLVHYSSEFSNLHEAIDSKQPNALTVVGVMYLMSRMDNPAFTPLLNALKHVKNSGETVQGTELNLIEFLPKYQRRIYNFQYDGSLTTPQFGECVLWNIFFRPSYVSRAQLNEFRSAMNAQNKPMKNNFRSIQPLNGREIRTYLTELSC